MLKNPNIRAISEFLAALYKESVNLLPKFKAIYVHQYSVQVGGEGGGVGRYMYIHQFLIYNYLR